MCCFYFQAMHDFSNFLRHVTTGAACVRVVRKCQSECGVAAWPTFQNKEKKIKRAQPTPSKQELISSCSSRHKSPSENNSSAAAAKHRLNENITLTKYWPDNASLSKSEEWTAEGCRNKCSSHPILRPHVRHIYCKRKQELWNLCFFRGWWKWQLMEQMRPDSRQILNIDLLHSLRVIEARLNGRSCQVEDSAGIRRI